MKNINWLLIWLSIVVLVISGCGGGGGSTPVTSNPVISDNSSVVSLITGYIDTGNTPVQSPIKGVKKSPLSVVQNSVDLSGIKITLKNTDKSTTTDSEGYFELQITTEYADIEKKLVVNKPGTGLEVTLSLDVASGQSSFLDIKLKKSGDEWSGKYYEEISDSGTDKISGEYDLWDEDYFVHYSRHSPDSWWKYQGKDKIFMKSSVRKQFASLNGSYELYINADMEDQLNDGTFMLNLYSSNPSDSEYMLFDKTGNLWGVILVVNKQPVTLTLSQPVLFSDLYNNQKIGKRNAVNLSFTDYPEYVFNFNEIFLGFEDVESKAGVFRDCAKFITKSSDGSFSISYYAKNIGEIGCENFSSEGVMEDYYELTSYNIQQNEPELPLSQKEWTIMYYGCADDSLTSDLTTQIIGNEFSDLLNSGSDENINIVFQMEPSRNNGLLSVLTGYYGYITNFTAYIEKDNIVNLRKNMSMNVGDPANLVEFVNYCKTNFPAKKYALVYSGHGAGSIYNNQSLLAPQKVIGIADSYDDFLSYPEINAAFLQITSILGEKLSLTVLDACLMSTMEMAYELREYTDYILASKFSTYGNKYSGAFSWLKSNTQSNGLELAKKIADYTYDYYNQANKSLTLSVIYPSYMNIFFMDKIRTFVNEVKNNQDLLEAFQTVNVLNNSSLFESGFSSPQIDFFEFLKFFNNPDIYGADLVNSAESLLSYKDLLIPYKVQNNLYYYDLDYNLRSFSESGISIFWPYYSTNQSLQILNYGNYINNTLTPKFNTDTGWSTIF